MILAKSMVIGYWIILTQHRWILIPLGLRSLPPGQKWRHLILSSGIAWPESFGSARALWHWWSSPTFQPQMCSSSAVERPENISPPLPLSYNSIMLHWQALPMGCLSWARPLNVSISTLSCSFMHWVIITFCTSRSDLDSMACTSLSIAASCFAVSGSWPSWSLWVSARRRERERAAY